MLSRVFQLLAKLLPEGTAIPVVCGPLAGVRWIAGAAAGGAKGLSVVVNRSEPEQLACAAAEVTDLDVCFDVGANVGMYTALFARRARTVFAFEPSPRNLAYLHRLVALNGLQRVTIVPLAVAASTGLDAFGCGRNHAEGHLARDGTQPVATVSLDEFVSHYAVVPTLVKIDVEGAEADVLRGARRVLSSHRPRLLLSTHGQAVRDECFRILAECGYSAPRPLNGSASEFFMRA
jgi:FkbM family methyltransferase